MTFDELKKKFSACDSAYLSFIYAESESDNFDYLLSNYYHLFNYYKGVAETLIREGDNSPELAKFKGSISTLLSNMKDKTETDLTTLILVPEIFINPIFGSDLLDVYINEGVILDKAFLNKAFQYALRAHISHMIPFDKSRFEFFDRLISLGAEIDAPVLDHQYSSLALSILENEPEIAQYLIGKGADIEAAKQQSRATDLIIFSAIGHQDQVEACLKTPKVDLNALTMWYTTALSHAAAANKPEIVKLLLEHKASPNIGPSILHWAAKNNYVDVVKALIDAGAHPNELKFMETPLIIAANLGHKEVVEALLSAPEIDIEIRTMVNLMGEGGETAKEIATSKGHTAIVDLINAFEERKDISNAQKDLRKLISELLVLSDGANKSNKKYAALINLQTKINETEFRSKSELKTATKNIVMLCLQHRNRDLRHTTLTGRILKELLNKEEYRSIRGICTGKSPKDIIPIKYRDLRSLITGSNDPKFFSARYKENMYDLVEKADKKFVDETHIHNYVSRLSKK